ncbi:acetylcholine receptor subunit beta-type acr-3-like [Ylistrum balloti]|uniref:acetylcholine receptor subunit beta-type acr-3-like n=1 Tax=Ylistrum balloti TaxID=509963 RepID=UPI002905F02B|nr:acetylcholine receptor subunit beta-type acr-3-like [Ylistrum balloti]
MSSVSFLLLILSVGATVMARRTMKDLEKLNDTLFEDYRPEFRPVFYIDDTLQVNVTYNLFSVIDFNVVTEIVSLSGVFVILWHDYRLQWDPDDFGGVEGMVLPASQLWLPSIVLINAADGMQHIGSDESNVYVLYNGDIYWNPGGVLISSCLANMRSFPKDHHICRLILCNMIHTSHEMELVVPTSAVNNEFLLKNGEWDVLGIHMSDKVDDYDQMESSSSSYISISIHMARKSKYFIINMLIPVTVLCILESFVFLIPVEASDRVSFSMTLFLALSVYMSVMGSFLPTTSERLPGMTYFLLASVLHSTMVVLMAIVTIRFSINDDLPAWLVRLNRIKDKRLLKRKQRKKKNEDLNENFPLDTKVHDTEIDIHDVLVKKSLLHAFDIFLFVITLASMVLMCLIFYMVYLTDVEDSEH